MWIQLLLVIAIATLGVIVMRRSGADSHLALRRLGLMLFVVVAISAVLFPQWLTFVANLIGVGRGADLLLYALVIVFLVFVFSQFRRNVSLQRQLTVLARRTAILEARETEREVAAHRTAVDRSTPASPADTEPDDGSSDEGLNRRL